MMKIPTDVFVTFRRSNRTSGEYTAAVLEIVSPELRKRSNPAEFARCMATAYRVAALLFEHPWSRHFEPACIEVEPMDSGASVTIELRHNLTRDVLTDENVGAPLIGAAYAVLDPEDPAAALLGSNS